MHPPFRLRISRVQAARAIERDVGAVPATIGRGSKSTIVLNDPTMSKEHAILLMESGSLVVRDLGSRNGVFVRGRTQRVESAILADVGFAFSIGPFDIACVPMHVARAGGMTALLARSDGSSGESRGEGIVTFDVAANLARYRAACADLYVALTEQLVALNPGDRAKWLRAFAAENPDAACQSLFRDLLASAEEDEVNVEKRGPTAAPRTVLASRRVPATAKLDTGDGACSTDPVLWR